MPFSTKEQEIIKYGQQNGKTSQQIQEAISNLRLGIIPQKKEPVAVAEPTLAQNIGNDFNQRADKLAEIWARPTDTKTKLQQSLGQGAGGAANIIEQTTMAIPGVKQAVGVIGEGMKWLQDTPVVKAIGDKLGSVPVVQDIVELYDTDPNFKDTVDGVANLARLGMDVQGVVDSAVFTKNVTSKLANKVSTKVSSMEMPKMDSFEKPIDQLRSEKLAQGFAEQNTRLKTAQKAFDENTITRTLEDGTKTKLTPIDTIQKYDLAPEVSKGTILMGDYKTGVGALGKIKEAVSGIGDKIDELIKPLNKTVPTDIAKENVIASIKNNPVLRQQGKVQSTINNIERIFEDYKASYGNDLPLNEVNGIRKVMNLDWNPETMDASRVVGDTMRDIIHTATGDTTIKGLLQEQGQLLSAKNYLEAINGSKVTGGRLGNYFARTTGAMIGAGIEGVPVIGPLVGMAGGELVARGLQQTQFKNVFAEMRALAQRSKTKDPTTSAKTIPNKAIIDDTIPQSGVLSKISDLSNTDITKIPPQAGLSTKKVVPTAEDIAKILTPETKQLMTEFAEKGRRSPEIDDILKSAGLEKDDVTMQWRFAQDTLDSLDRFINEAEVKKLANSLKNKSPEEIAQMLQDGTLTKENLLGKSSPAVGETANK